MPVGTELKEQIATTLKIKLDHHNVVTAGNDKLHRALLEHCNNDRSLAREYVQECDHICANMPLAISIDNFLDSQRGNDKLALCGKIGIVDCILKAEKKSKIYVGANTGRKGIDFRKLESTWYVSFFKTLIEGCDINELPARFSTITLIIFNYDRCVEYFLLQVLTSYFRIKDSEALVIIAELTIIHPYGTVGELPGFAVGGVRETDYGEILQQRYYVEQANSIRTFTEGAISQTHSTLREKMAEANRLIFLGFAFHRLNMELLSAGANKRHGNSFEVNCYATGYELSQGDCDSIGSAVKNLYLNGVSINLENSTCDGLFKAYSRTLGYD